MRATVAAGVVSCIGSALALTNLSSIDVECDSTAVDSGVVSAASVVVEPCVSAEYIGLVFDSV